MKIDWTLNETDVKLLNQLGDFVPERVFDAHAHIYDTRHHDRKEGSLWASSPEIVGIAEWKKAQEQMLGESKLCGALLFPMPTDSSKVDAANQHLINELNANAGYVGALLVSHNQNPQDVRNKIELAPIAALKPYHLMADVSDTLNLSPGEYLPEWAWEIANDLGLAIVLHLVRDRASADEENSDYIRRHCTKYPNAKLILAHCARGFCSDTAREGLPELSKLRNIWLDCSGICEAETIESVLMNFGPDRLMWGSDFPICQQRARAVTVGDGFHWVEVENSPLCNQTLVGVESLRALKKASESFGLNTEDIRKIFYHNAAQLFGFERKPQNITQDLYNRAKQRIPGGVQLLSKRPEMMAPQQWPAYFTRAVGCEVWDTDGRHYYDMSTNGIGACLLGYRDAYVSAAVKRRINMGSMSTLNPPEELCLADMLCDIHPWAQQVRFTRTGGECAAVAVRIARATTDRSMVAVCGYHGWQDWYMAANLGEDDSLRGHLLPGLDPLGVPVELRGTAHTFEYEDTDRLDQIIAEHGDKLAAVIMEPCRYRDPKPGFLEYVRDAAHRCGALLIFDEITIGWRYHFGGAHLKLGTNPDIAIFAKALGNGHPIAAVVGTKEAMSGAESSFISSTYWTESVGPVAGLATLERMRQLDVVGHVAKIGKLVTEGWQKASARHSLPITAGDGYPCLAHFAFDSPDANLLKTLYVQLMLERGFLASTAIYPTIAHTPEIIGKYAEAANEVFGIISQAVQENRAQDLLNGPQAHTGFRRLL